MSINWIGIFRSLITARLLQTQRDFPRIVRWFKLAPGAWPNRWTSKTRGCAGSAPTWRKAVQPEFDEHYDELVSGTQTIENQTVELRNLALAPGASLTIRNATVITGKHGVSGLHVESGGALYIYDSTFQLHPLGYGFELSPGHESTFEMTDSEVHGAGFEWWYGGLNIMASDFIITRNRFSHTLINILDDLRLTPWIYHSMRW